MKIRASIHATAFLTLCTAAANLSQAFPGYASPPPPTVQIVAPGEGEEFVASNNISILALSQDFRGGAAQVQFFATSSTGSNSVSLGTVVNNSNSRGGNLCGRFGGQYTLLVWTNAAVGDYALTAEAFGAGGVTATSAPVDISVVTDIPPAIRIVKPRDGAMILGPTNITIDAGAFDREGAISSVEFFAGPDATDVTNSLGVATNPPVIMVTNRFGVFTFQPKTYSVTWSNVAPGDYVLNAVATDTNGVTTTSSNVDISVVTNLPPVVTIVRPFDGQSLEAPANIGLFAVTCDSDGSVTNVEFFAGTNLIGSATNGTSLRVGHAVQALYAFYWTNVPAASYDLTAVAMSAESDSGTSAPVAITVYPPPPPIVKIVNPENRETFHAPANVYITAFTEHFTNRIASVQFLAGTNSLATLTNSPWPTSYFWRNVPAGEYTLTAVATDTASNTATSSPVDITVTTNRPVWHY